MNPGARLWRILLQRIWLNSKTSGGGGGGKQCATNHQPFRGRFNPCSHGTVPFVAPFVIPTRVAPPIVLLIQSIVDG
jgi:hypothetical protein